MLPTMHRSSITEYDFRAMTDAMEEVELKRIGSYPQNDGLNMMKEINSSTELCEMENTKDDKEEEAHKAFLAKLSKRWFTAEPAMIVYMLAYVSLLPIMQQYMYRRLAVDFNITEAENPNKTQKQVCLERYDVSAELLENEHEFQEAVSLWNTLMVICGLLPTLFVIILIGPLSDTRGRKFGFVPQTGAAVCAGIAICFVVAYDLHIGILPIIQLICGLTGAMPAVTTSTFAYIADINPPEKRFIRILIIEIGLGLGTLVGQLFFGWLIEEAGFVPPVIIFTVLQFSIFIYVAFFLPETVRRKPGVRTCTSASFMTLPRLWFVGKDRMRMMTIWISFALIFVTGLVQDVPNMILTFIFLDPPLCWGSLLIGAYNGVSFILRAIGSIVLMRLLFKRAPDAVLQFISLVSGALLFLCLGFSTDDWVPFLGAVLASGTMLLSPVTRAVASRSVPDAQQGALFAGLGLAQMLAMLIGTPVINIVYADTSPDDRGNIFFVLMAALVIPMILVGVGWYFDKRRQPESKDSVPTKVPSCDVAHSEYATSEHQSKPRVRTPSTSTSEQNNTRNRKYSRSSSRDNGENKLYIISDGVPRENV